MQQLQPILENWTILVITVAEDSQCFGHVRLGNYQFGNGYPVPTDATFEDTIASVFNSIAETWPNTAAVSHSLSTDTDGLRTLTVMIQRIMRGPAAIVPAGVMR